MILHCTKLDANSELRRWFVAATHPRKEELAQQNLDRQGFSTFYPRIRTGPRRGRAAGLTPLFPGYVFVNFDPEAGRWRAINSTFGIKGLIGGHAGRPAEVPESIVSELVSRCPSGVWDQTEPALVRGQTVNLVGGPFSGFTGQFEELLPHQRVSVLMSWLNNTIAVTLPLNCIEAAA